MQKTRNLILMVLAAWAVVSCLGDGATKEWNYIRSDADKGPESWDTNFAQCGNSKNSPIDIPTDKQELYGMEAAKWTLKNWNDDFLWTVLDTHYTVKFSLEDGQEMSTSGGGLGDKFDVVQFHLHWGATDKKGSEHKLGGTAYPLEIHFVHKNSRYATLDAAVNSEDSDALAAVGFFFKIQVEDNPDLDELIEGVTQVRAAAAQSYTVPGYNLTALTFVEKATKGSYFRYFGGLTTPGCQEIVEWTVFEKPIGISSAQMETIRTQTVKTYGDDLFRDVQPIGSREITIYDVDYDPSNYSNKAASFSTAAWSITFISLMITKML